MQKGGLSRAGFTGKKDIAVCKFNKVKGQQQLLIGLAIHFNADDI